MKTEKTKKLIGVLIISHENFSRTAIETAELFVGKQSNCISLPYLATESLEKFENKLKSSLELLDSGYGVIIIADLVGGSPANSAIKILGSRVHLITGLSLPLLLQVLTNRESDVSEFNFTECISETKASILHINDLIQ